MDWNRYCIQRGNDVTRARRASGQLADAAAAVSGGMTSFIHSFIHDLHLESTTEMRLSQSMPIYPENNPAKCHPDPI